MAKKAYTFEPTVGGLNKTIISLESTIGYDIQVTADGTKDDYFNLIFATGNISTQFKLTDKAKAILENYFKTDF